MRRLGPSAGQAVEPVHGARARSARLAMRLVAGLSVVAALGLCVGLCAALIDPSVPLAVPSVLPSAVGTGPAPIAAGADLPLWPPSAWSEPVTPWLAKWAEWHRDQPVLAGGLFVLVFALLSALSVPGCAPLALLAGTSFGLVGGTLLVGLASTLGALGPFLVARHLAREAVQRRLGHRLASLEARLARDSRLWLFWLRLVPLVPYPLLNPMLGLSRLSLSAFLWPSLAGLTLASVPYVAVGQSLGLWWQHGDWTGALVGVVVALVALALLWRWRRRLPPGLQPDPARAAEGGGVGADLPEARA